MGGRGSGRARTRIEVEDVPRLSLSRMLRTGHAVPGEVVGRELAWTIGGDGEVSARVVAELREHHGKVIVFPPVGCCYVVDVVSHPQPFGGRRWWFLCPVLRIAVAALYLPAGAVQFASRQAHELTYRAQRLDARGRAAERAANVRAMLGGERDPDAPFPERPKGMRRSTYERHRARAGAG